MMQRSCVYTANNCEGLLPMAVKRVVEGVHVVPMGMANAYLIEGIEVIHAPGPARDRSRCCGSATSGARNRLPDIGGACFGVVTGTRPAKGSVSV
jgi:hypothetical protein